MTRAADKAKIEANKKRLKTGRDRKMNPGDTSNDIYVERNSLAAQSSLSVTKTESMEVVPAVEEKRQVTFTHAIDDLVVCSSAPTEIPILHDIFLKKNGLI